MNKILVAFIMAVALLVAGFSEYNEDKNYHWETVTYTVRQGDTIWGVAGKLQDRYNDYRDIREIIYETGGAKNPIVPGDKLIFKMRCKNV